MHPVNAALAARMQIRRDFTIGLDSTCGGTDAMPKRGGQPEHARSWRAAKKRHCITGKERALRTRAQWADQLAHHAS